MITPTEQLDSRVRIVTPENIAFEYRVAGPFWRLPAYLIDLGIRLAAFGFIAIVSLFAFGFAGLGSVGIFITFVSWLALAWFYGGLFETLWNGQTPGKRLLKLRVISTDGRPINGLQAVLRNILRVVDALPTHMVSPEIVMPTYLFGLAAASCSSHYQRLGDLACGTMVVVEERHGMHGVARVPGQEIDNVARLIPAGWIPSRTLARALSQYVERRQYFGVARRAEIARHVGSVLMEKLSLPTGTDHDALLCALYRKSFLADVDVGPTTSLARAVDGESLPATIP